MVEADGIPIVMTKWRCEDLTEEHLAPYLDDPTITYAAINHKLTRIELPDDDGCRVRLLKIQMPMFISTRSNLLTLYKYSKEDGTQIIIHSSQGNEALIETYADQINGDVVINNVLSYTAWKPYPNGMELSKISKVDLNGMIPYYIKQIAASR